MKKTLIFCSLALFFSCEKPEAEYCWDCMVYSKTASSGTTYQTSIAQTKCGMSTREIELFEQKQVFGEITTWATCQKQ